MLVELSSLVGVKVDETARAMVSFVAVNEPVTMYRVARGLNMHFSHVYRKVNKLVAQRLLEPASAGRSTVYYATVRGLLIPLIYGTAPKSLILAKIKRRLRLESFSDEEVEAFLKFYGRVAAGDAPSRGWSWWEPTWPRGVGIGLRSVFPRWRGGTRCWPAEWPPMRLYRW